MFNSAKEGKGLKLLLFVFALQIIQICFLMNSQSRTNTHPQDEPLLIVGCVHDEILLEAPAEATEEVALILKRTMEEAGKIFLKALPVEAEVVVVDSWAEK